MTAPAPAKPCEHCKASPVSKRVATSVPGTKPVVISMCRCDYLSCVHCGTTVYDRTARRCTCGKDPGTKR